MRINLRFVQDALTPFFLKHDFVQVMSFPEKRVRGVEQALYRNDHIEMRVVVARAEIEVEARSVEVSTDWYQLVGLLEMIDGFRSSYLDERTMPSFLDRIDTCYQKLVEFFSPAGGVTRDQYLLWSEEQYWKDVRERQAARQIARKPWWKFW